MGTFAEIKTQGVNNYDYIAVISISGELDESNLHLLEENFSVLLPNLNKKIFILDLTGLIFMSSKIIGYLASLHTTLTHEHRKIILASYNENIADIIRLVGLDKLIPSYLSLEDALEDNLNTIKTTI